MNNNKNKTTGNPSLKKITIMVGIQSDVDWVEKREASHGHTVLWVKPQCSERP